MNTIDVLKQSLAMLEELTSLGDFGGSVRYDINKTIAALEQAIKQEEQQPVPVKTYSGGKAWPVQAEWAGLTDAEFDEIHESNFQLADAMIDTIAKLKEKNSKG